MFKKSLLTLFAALSLAGAFTAQADPPKKAPPPPPPIPISSLPFAIYAPGTYVLTGNLSYPATDSVNPVAIGINIPAQGLGSAIILDFKGFTITNTTTDANLQSRSQGIRIVSNQNIPILSPIPITIRNGTLVNFNWGVFDLLVSGITVNNMTFNEVAYPLTINYPTPVVVNSNW